MSDDNGIQINPTEEFPHLAAAPIVEAIIHFRARASNWPGPDGVREYLRAKMSDYPKCHPQHQLELEAEVAADGTASRQVHHTSWRGFRLTSEDERFVVQFTRDGVAFSRLTPYEHWETFVEKARETWRSFNEFAMPSEVQRLGVRFINRIVLHQPGEVRDYLASPPECLEGISLPTVDFTYQSQHAVPGHPYAVSVVRALQPPGPKQSEFGLILDIDAGTTRAVPCDEAVLHEHLRAMHWLKNKVFFNLLLPDATEKFKKGTP